MPELGPQPDRHHRRRAQDQPRSSTPLPTSPTSAAASLNPNLADAAVEEMLIQHLLTERLFRTVFDNPDFIRRNVIAAEIEKVIDALTSPQLQPRRVPAASSTASTSPSRQAAATITDFSAETAVPQHRLRAVLPGLLRQGRRHPRHRLHAAADRAISWSPAWRKS